jgi:signal transduction histidine kinase
MTVLGENWMLVVVGVLFALVLGCLIGYLIGNTSLRSKVTANMDGLERDMQIHKAVLDSVGIGMAVYDNKGAIFANETIFKLQDFLKGGLPNTIDDFLNEFDNGNLLKSNYILSCENGINVVRVNYFVGRKIYEIKVIRKTGEQNDKYFSGEVLNLVIVDDITQIKDDERRQKDLAANVSHELKTPLTSINNSVFSIINACGKGKMPERDNLLTWSQRIQDNSIRMQDIVSDFLVLSQCSHTSRMGIFDIRDCVEQAYAGMADYPGSRGVVFTLPDDTPMPLLYGNHKLIIRCVINLLTNAVKYINYDGKTARNQIHVSLHMIDDRVAVQVEDNGRGIPAKDIDHLFERFYRVDNSGSREVGGSGIGLAIAKEIADMHDGVISVSSVFGNGATFTLSLPTAKSVFNGVIQDVMTGVISEKPLYRAAAYFMGLQECEAVKSLGYTDLAKLVEEYEAISETDVPARDKALTDLLRAFGKERFASLEDELLSTDDFDETDGPVTGLEDEDIAQTTPAAEAEKTVEEAQNVTVTEPVKAETAEKEEEPASEEVKEADPEITDPSANNEELLKEQFERAMAERAAQKAEAERIEKEQQLLAKAEARKLLTQPIVQISADQKPAQQTKKDVIDKKTIHPITNGKRYNRGRATPEAEDAAASAPEQTAEKPGSETKSALKKLLDDSTPQHLK